MDKIFVNNNCVSEEELEELHKCSQKLAIEAFESHSFPLMYGFDFNDYVSKLEEKITEEFEKYVTKNQINRELKRRDLKDIIEDLFKSYEDQIEEHIDSVDSETQLIQKHENIKKEIIFRRKIN